MGGGCVAKQREAQGRKLKIDMFKLILKRLFACVVDLAIVAIIIFMMLNLWMIPNGLFIEESTLKIIILYIIVYSIYFPTRYFPEALQQPIALPIRRIAIDEIGFIGSERFTIAHEIVHWEIHQRFFTNWLKKNNTAFRCPKEKSKERRTAIDWCEWQAEGIAASILMPKNMFIQKANEINEEYQYGLANQKIIKEIAKFFEVSKQACHPVRVNC